MRVTTIFLVLLLASTAAWAKRPGSADAKAVARSGNAFALDLYGVLREKKGNLFLSPYSISAALSMARAGAGGNTAEEMDAVLHRPGDGAAGQRALALALRPRTVADGHGRDARKVSTHELHIANALWVQDGLALKAPFTDTMKTAFGALPERVDFRRVQATRERINDWVEEQTQNRIRDIVPPGMPPPSTLLTLANAIYFKASWKEPFRESRTKPGPFACAGGKTARVPFMRMVEDLGYVETPEVQVLELPYRAGEISMIVLLPRKKNGLETLEKGLTAEVLASLLDKMSHTSVDVSFPKFELTTSLDLTETLHGMGMRDAFDRRRADFTAMADVKPLFLGAVLHKAFVSVDEAGTEAAAATIVMTLGAKAGTGGPVEFKADHPFLFLIRHHGTGAILFLGRVADPSAR
jgi:serpin B